MKALIIGIAISVLAGVAAGDAMRPVLAVAPPPMEPVAWGAGPPSYADSAGVWTGRGQVPDYVVGTDWLPRPPDPIVLPDVTWPEMERPEPAAAPPAVDAAWRDGPTPPAPAYPSEQGDILAGVRTTSSVEASAEPPAA